MIGIDLATYDATLRKVPAHLGLKPVRAFDAHAALGPNVRRYMQHVHECDDLEEHAHRLPGAAFARADVDTIGKVVLSSRYSLDSNLRDHLQKDPSVRLLDKIRSSVWRWSFRRASWNEMVDAYQGIAAFDLGVPGLDVTFDHTTWVHERGRAEHSRIYLDGVFAFLVHHKGEHVMTIGFSIASGRRLLLQQVQLTKRTGNRWLFKFPGNRMELVIDRLRAAFPRHRLLVVDGGDVAGKNLGEYVEGRKSAKRRIAEYEDRLKRGVGDPSTLAESIAEHAEHAARMGEKIVHLKADMPRLKAFYGDMGRYRATRRRFHTNGMTHYAIAA